MADTIHPTTLHAPTSFNREFWLLQRRCLLNQAEAIGKALGLDNDLLVAARAVVRENAQVVNRHDNPDCTCCYCVLAAAVKQRS